MFAGCFPFVLIGFVICRFMYIIRSDAGQPLREELAKSPDKIIASAFPEFSPKSEMTQGSSNPSSSVGGDESLVTPKSEDSAQLVPSSMATSDAYFQGLALVKTLVKLMPAWLQSNRVVFDTLVQLWKSPARISRLQNEQELNLMQVSELITSYIYYGTFIYVYIFLKSMLCSVICSFLASLIFHLVVGWASDKIFPCRSKVDEAIIYVGETMCCASS